MGEELQIKIKFQQICYDIRKFMIFLRFIFAFATDFVNAQSVNTRLRGTKSTFAEATVDKAGCSAARLAHLVWDQRVAGSNPATPTKEKAWHEVPGFIFPLR